MLGKVDKEWWDFPWGEDSHNKDKVVMIPKDKVLCRGMQVRVSNNNNRIRSIQSMKVRDNQRNQGLSPLEAKE